MSKTAEINLLPKQTEAWEHLEDETTTELGYGGAAGGGKTRLGWYVAVFMYCEKYAGATFAIGRKELKTLRLTSLAELWRILAELGYRDQKDFTFNAQDNIIKFPNGSQIILLDMAYSPQDPEYTRFGSLNLTGAWVEESNESPDKGVTILRTRVGRNNKFNMGTKEKPNWIVVKGIFLETFNPNKGRVYREYYKPWKEGTLPHYRKFVRALPGDNPHLPPAYIEGLKRADPVTRARLLDGNFDFDDDPKKIFNYQAILDLRFNVVPIGIRPVKTLICDVARFGGDKIVIGVFRDLELYALYVYTYQGTDETVKQIKNVCAIEQVTISNVLVDEDGVGGGVVDHLRGCKGFNGNASPSTLFSHYESRMVHEEYRNARSQCYFILAGTVNNHGMAVRITKFETNIEGYTLEKALSDMEEELDAIKETDRSGDDTKFAIVPKSEIKEALGRSPDFADVLMMRMFFEVKKPAVEDPYLVRGQASGPKKVKVNRAR